MNKTAVLALDLSPAAEPLLECAAELRRWGVGRLVITPVVRIGYGQDPGERALQEITEWLEGRALRLRSADLRVEVAVRAAGTPVDGILAVGNEAKADLIVLGSRSHNLASRVFLGSVARDMARRTQLPLLLEWLEPTGDGIATVCADTLRHVLLATDLSKHAGAAEHAAVALAAHAQRVDCLAVLTPEALDATPALPAMARAALDGLVARIDAACPQWRRHGDLCAAVARGTGSDAGRPEPCLPGAWHGAHVGWTLVGRSARQAQLGIQPACSAVAQPHVTAMQARNAARDAQAQTCAASGTVA